MKAYPFIIALLLLCSAYLPIFSQESICDEPNPFYRTEKITIEKGKKHTEILGCLPDGTILVKSYTGKTAKYFWIDGNRATKEVFFPKPLTGMATLDGRTIYCTIENMSGLFKIELDASLNPDKSELFPGPENWDGEILNPFLFHLHNSRYPALLFASRPQGQKDYDLFVSEISSRTGWSTPQPLEKINTSYNELHPSVSIDGMLFFMSDRPGSDCYVPGKLDPWHGLPDTRHYWQDPIVNQLPNPFASRADEHTLIVKGPDISSGYFVSKRGGKAFELYAFESTDNVVQIKPRYRALIIGVNEYNYLTRLKEPVPNSIELAKILAEKYCMDVERLENPTKAEILEKLSQYHQLQENDYLFISFFGHGLPIPDLENAVSCRLAGIDTRDTTTNCISPDEFHKAIFAIDKPKHIVIVLDACFAGLFTPKVPMNLPGNIAKQKSRELLTSANAYFTYDESKFFIHFTNCLLEGHDHPLIQLTINDCYRSIDLKMREIDHESEPKKEEKGDNLPRLIPLFGANGGSFPFPLPCK